MKWWFLLFGILFYFECSSQTKEFSIGLSQGISRPNLLSLCPGYCTYSKQKIRLENSLKVIFKGKANNIFYHKGSINFYKTSKNIELQTRSIYQRAGITRTLRFIEGPIEIDYSIIAVNYQFIFQPFKKFDIQFFTGISKDYIINNKSKTHFKYTRVGALNSDYEYIELTEPEISYKTNNKNLGKGFDTFQLGIGYSFKFPKVEINPNFEYLFLWNKNNAISKSRINLNLEFNYVINK